MNERAELERRLASVLEPQKPEQAPQTEKEISLQVPAQEVAPISLQSSSEKKGMSLDEALVKTITAKGSKQSKKVAIRYGAHEASPHQIELVRLAHRIVWETRERVMDSVHHWRAPFFPPPTLDEFAAPGELRVHKIDPRSFLSQFTPGDPDEAYAKCFGLLSRLREPFIRWEHDAQARAEQTSSSKPVSALHRVEGELVHAVESVKEIEEEIVHEAEADWGVPTLVPKLVPWRVVAGFLVLAVLVTAPAGAVHFGRSLSTSWAEVSSRGEAALQNAELAMSGSELAQADAWRSVSEEFKASDRALNEANSLAVALSKALPQTRSYYASARALLRSGDRAAQAAEALSQGMTRAFDEPARYPVDRLHVFAPYLEQAMNLLDEAVQVAGEVEVGNLPSAAKEKTGKLIETLISAQTSVREISLLQSLAIRILGDDHQRRYLFIFQNPAELRPTGGFMGSLADVIVDRGEMRKITVPGGGPYDLRSQLTERVLPPEPLGLIASRWEFQDANWFPDFYTSAEKIRWFWMESGQPTIDGVISINADVMVELLKVTGPIEMPEYGKTITADNFLLETQKAVELEYDRTENKPKKFIGDLMPRVLERLKQGKRDDMLKLAGLLSQSLERKDIQVALFDEDEQALIERFGWGGRFQPTEGDALAIIDTNIAGQKSDTSISEHVQVDTQIQPDGAIENTVTITRSHAAEKGELFHGANNVDYLRVYVPNGSELLNAEGFDPPASDLFKKPLATDKPDADLARIEQNVRSGPGGVVVSDELGRTSFGGWVQLEPGETRTTVFRYRLPVTAFDIAASLSDGGSERDQARAVYTMLLTSQSGKAGRTFEQHVHYPESWTTVWNNTDAGAELSGTWDHDTVNALVFSTNDRPKTGE